VSIESGALQRIQITGEDTAGLLIARLAATVLDLNAQLADLDTRIAERFRSHSDAAVLTSMVGIGDLLGAGFLAATGGSLDAFASADHLAGYAGLAPTPRDSGSRVGNLHRPRRYNRQLQRVFYTSALISIQRSLPPAPTASGNEPKANDTARPSWPLPGAASTCSGPCSATNAITRIQAQPWPERLDNRIENQPSSASATPSVRPPEGECPRGEYCVTGVPTPPRPGAAAGSPRRGVC